MKESVSMSRITVYTATYNRAYTLHKGYESLCGQTCKDFEWLIVDDGSTDNTEELVKSWIKENKIPIRYIYQENKGVNAARNLAIDNIGSELNVCVDSDDYLTTDAIEKILDIWDSRKSNKYVGVIALDCYENGEIVGRQFPNELKEATLFELYEKHKVNGDKKMAYLTHLCKKYPTPSFEGEKYYPNRYKYYMLDKEGPCLLINEPICVVEYLEDGITASRYKRYMNNPLGLASYRQFLIDYNPKIDNKFKQSIHFIAMNLIAYKKLGLKNTKYKLTTLLASPIGIGWYIIIKYRSRRL